MRIFYVFYCLVILSTFTFICSQKDPSQDVQSNHVKMDHSPLVKLNLLKTRETILQEKLTQEHRRTLSTFTELYAVRKEITEAQLAILEHNVQETIEANAKYASMVKEDAASLRKFKESIHAFEKKGQLWPLDGPAGPPAFEDPLGEETLQSDMTQAHMDALLAKMQATQQVQKEITQAISESQGAQKNAVMSFQEVVADIGSAMAAAIAEKTTPTPSQNRDT